MLVQHRALDVLFRPELVIEQPAGPDIAHAGLDVRPLVAGRDVIELEHAAEIAVELDQHAFAETGRLDGGHRQILSS